MPPPSASAKKSLTQRILRYNAALKTPAGAPLLEYLKGERKLTDATIDHFLLGAVLDPDPLDEGVRGWLSIPFLTPNGPTAMRFRRPPERDSGPKYMQPEGSHLTLFNVQAFRNTDTTIVVAEGEFEAVALHQCGIPAIGVPGGNAWKASYSPLFEGYERVIIPVDNDGRGDLGPQQAGKKFAASVARDVPGPEVILCPEGYDINGLLAAEGVQAVRDLLGVDRQRDE